MKLGNLSNASFVNMWGYTTADKHLVSVDTYMFVSVHVCVHLRKYTCTCVRVQVYGHQKAGWGVCSSHVAPAGLEFSL